MKPRRSLDRRASIAILALSLIMLTAAAGSSLASVPSLGRADWMWSSVPVGRVEPGRPIISVSSLVEDHVRLEWYNPRPGGLAAAREWDLNPLLTDSEGGGNIRQVLEWHLPLPTGENSFGPEAWTGLSQSISIPPADLSKSRFIEIWVNDFTPLHSQTKATLRLDLGSVSEDAFWSTTAPPNYRLDTEDKNFDGVLDLGYGISDPSFEDTGLDGVVSTREPGYDPNTNTDPDGDNYHYDALQSPDDYSTIDNFELNSLGSAHARPDTEDLNHNSFLDLDNDYFEATLDLSDSQYVAVDVPVKYQGNSHVHPNNGWRLFHIPLSAEAFRSVGSPTWESVRTIRLWIGDLAAATTLQIGGISIDRFSTSAPVKVVALHQNSPNPFNPSTSIPYELEKTSHVRLTVYDVQGRLVRELVNDIETVGSHRASWSGEDQDGRAVASGIYIYQITVDGRREARRMVLVR